MLDKNDQSPDVLVSANPLAWFLSVQNSNWTKLFTETLNMYQNYWGGALRYMDDFFYSAFKAVLLLNLTEAGKISNRSLEQNLSSFNELFFLSADLLQRAVLGTLDNASDYHIAEMENFIAACVNSAKKGDLQELQSYVDKQANAMQTLSIRYPQAIRQIGNEFGFHFQDPGYEKIAETDRYYLYQILPSHAGVKVKKQAKPVLIIPPYVLGSGILAFLPGEDKSYAHAFANQGIPTYIRIVKDISIHPAVQIMDGENDALDCRYFCEQIHTRHKKPVTLNGYCQGGFTALLNLLSGELDGLVDALITCVAPIDGSKSKTLNSFLSNLPQSYNDMSPAVKRLSNGNQVVDGDVMSLLYKLASIEDGAPLVAFYRDLAMFGLQNKKRPKITKTAAALNYWMIYGRQDLPLKITELSFKSYNNPISDDGTLPVQLFGRGLNIKKIQEQGINWLICYGEDDELVEKESAVAGLDFVDAEIAEFPKGHVAIAVTWSHPDSECALHTRFGEQNFRGPVRFQMDLDAELKKKKSRSVKVT